MKLFIKNMVCPRCIMAVEEILRRNDIDFSSVKLGEVQTVDELTTVQIEKLSQDLLRVGFELLSSQKSLQIEKTKNVLISIVQAGEISTEFSLSKELSKAHLKEYSQISKLFTEVEGITIEQFFILQKIEKVKEWLVYNEYSLNDIAFKLGYSSVQHLSTQFKKLTGMTPGAFKKIGSDMRKSLDSVSRRP